MAWTDNREMTAILLFDEHNLLAAIARETEARNVLEQRLNEIEEEQEVVGEKLTSYKEKRDEATEDGKRKKYERKITKWEMKCAMLDAATAKAREEFKEAHDSRLQLEKDSNNMRAEIKEKLKDFNCDKYVTVLGIEDAAAISMFRDLAHEGKKLIFVIGKSIRKSKVSTFNVVLDKMGLKIRSDEDVYYELTNEGLRILSGEEVLTLKGIRGGKMEEAKE